MPCPSAWLVKPWTKSSAGNLAAGRDSSPNRSRTVLLYWLCVSLPGDLRTVRTAACRQKPRWQADGSDGWPRFAGAFRLRFPDGCALRRYGPVRLVGFRSSRESSSRFGLMKARRFRPNWSISSGVAFSAGKAESCARGYAIVVVAEAALGFFEDRVEFFGEEVFGVGG